MAVIDAQTNIYPTSSSTSLLAITPSDSTIYDPPLRGVYIGVTGNVALLGDSDTAAITFVGVPAGTVLPVVAMKVMSTNTTASSIVGLK